MLITFSPATLLILKGLLLKIVFWFTFVYISFSSANIPSAKWETIKLPVEVPINKSYFLFLFCMRYCATPPANAPLLPPPEITSAFFIFYYDLITLVV